MHRAGTIVSNEAERSKEVEHIKSALRVNSYPEWMFEEKKAKDGDGEDIVDSEPLDTSQAVENQDTPSTVTVKKKVYPVVIPYVKGVSEQLRRTFKRFEVPLYFKPSNTLRQLLVRPKDPLAKEKVVGPVYHIPCEECPASYIGETERSLKARFSEHRRPSSVNSEVSQHIHQAYPGHRIDMDKTKILTVEPRWFERGVKEAIYIRAKQPSLNKDGGRFNLSPIWTNLLKARLGGPRS